MSVVIAIVVGILVMAVLVMRTAKGDLVKVAIPRTVTGQLAMGTRLDAAAALKKRGVPRAKIEELLDGDHDQELVDLYWSTAPTPPSS